MKNTAQKIIGFMDVAEKLCHVKRFTLIRGGGGDWRYETDSDHIMKLAPLVMMTAPYLKQPHDTQKMLEMALVHDLAEADAGDTPFFDQLDNPEIKAEKKSRERAAVEKYRDMLPPELGDKIFDLFMEFEEKKTFEARLVRALDKLEGNIQCNKENFGARYYARALTPIMDAMRKHKFSASLDEEIIFAIENALIEIGESNIAHCKKEGLI
jgi:putative hydrolase of HD superfamily